MARRERGVEGGAVGVGRQNAAEETQAERQVASSRGRASVSSARGRRPAQSVCPKDGHGAGGEPVHQGRLVEEANAIDGRGDEVVADQHLAGDFEVDGVDVVEQAGSEEAADVQDEPGEDDEASRRGFQRRVEASRGAAWCAVWIKRGGNLG